MNIVINHPEVVNESSILFTSIQCWNPVAKIIAIAARVNGKRITCRVSVKDLKVKFRAFRGDPIVIASEHRAEIEHAATKLIENNSFEEDGSIMIRYADL